MDDSRLKRFRSHIHLPHGHLAVRMDHLIHDDRFWAMVVIAALLIAFAAIVIWAGTTIESTPGTQPIRPLYPYMP